MIGSPIVYVLFTLPANVLAMLPGGDRLAAAVPFHFGRHPFG